MPVKGTLVPDVVTTAVPLVIVELPVIETVPDKVVVPDTVKVVKAVVPARVVPVEATVATAVPLL
jgi:hypothetical protein